MRGNEERQQRWLDNQLWLEQCRQRDEEQRAAYRRKQAEKAEQARREAAIAAEQEREKARRESRERYAHEAREREIRDLRFKVTQQEAWQRNVDRAAHAAVVQKQRQALLADLSAA